VTGVTWEQILTVVGLTAVLVLVTRRGLG